MISLDFSHHKKNRVTVYLLKDMFKEGKCFSIRIYYYYRIDMNRFEKIAKFLLSMWIAVLCIMVVGIIIKPNPTPTWFPPLMWTLMYIWITLLLPISLSFVYLIWDRMKRRLSKMTETEIIDYWSTRQYSNFNP